MKLVDISDASLAKIYACLNKNPRETAQFARTNYRNSKIAKSQGCLKKKAHYLVIIYKKNTERIKVILRDQSNGGIALSRKKGRLQHSIVPKMRMLMNIILQKCSTLLCVTLKNLVVTEEMMTLIRDILLPFVTSKLGYFTFENCEFECSADQLFGTMESLKVSAIELLYAKLNNMKITTMHLRSDYSSIQLHSKTGNQSEIDDQILTNWLYKMPKFVDLGNNKTKITLTGVLAFIKKCSNNPPPEDKSYNSWSTFYLGELKTDQNYEKQLCSALVIPEIKWETSVQSYDPNMRSYRVTLGCHMIVMFEIPLAKFARITRQQARIRIDDLRVKIAEKQLINPGYIVDDDMPMKIELEQLLSVIYLEWNNLRDEIEALKLIGANVDEAQWN